MFKKVCSSQSNFKLQTSSWTVSQTTKLKLIHPKKSADKND